MQIIPFVNSVDFKAGQILDATIYNSNVTDCIIVFGEDGGTTVLFPGEYLLVQPKYTFFGRLKSFIYKLGIGF